MTHATDDVWTMERARQLMDTPNMDLRQAARALDDQLIHLSRLAGLIEISSQEVDRLGLHPVQPRADALNFAAYIMLKDLERRLSELVQRMLNASDV